MFTGFTTAHNDSDCWIYDGNSMAGSSCEETNPQETPTKEQLEELDCLKYLDPFETMCKVLNIPMEVKGIWAERRLMPWFRANMTAWLR